MTEAKEADIKGMQQTIEKWQRTCEKLSKTHGQELEAKTNDFKAQIATLAEEKAKYKNETTLLAVSLHIGT